MWTIASQSPDDPDAATTIRDYIGEVWSRYYGRPAAPHDIDAVLVKEPADDLVPPGGTFLLARNERDGTVAGCAGVRLLDPRTAELTKLFVYPAARRWGCATRLLRAAEDAARALGAHIVRLHTRRDLVEARRFYAARGYADAEPYLTGPLVDYSFAKTLR
ncbi:GNAT family N-acetyltransferase [Amycolatopsis pigmentata]|uniref:GNAT family N-acetyltransferase n=1 Tax=Amycolatopsis pigmentata TaxID=450801 RepID=A0ABW5G045_9PSEU